MLTLDEFRASARRMSIAAASDATDIDFASETPADTVAIHLFCGGCWVTENGHGVFETHIGLAVYSGDFNHASGALWAEYYATECCDLETLHASDGTLDAHVTDYIAAHPDIDPDADDWGGIFGMLLTGESYSSHEVYDAVRNAIETRRGVSLAPMNKEST